MQFIKVKTVFITISLIISILAIAFSLLLACTQETTLIPEPALENTTWVLRAYGQPGSLKSSLTGTLYRRDIKITTVFNKATGQVAGSSGVNTYWGNYTLENSKLSISGIMITALGGPQTLMDQENEFIKLLGATESYQIQDSRLQINCGQQVLIFMEQQ
jgi:heat shock protein HslJ